MTKLQVLMGLEEGRRAQERLVQALEADAIWLEALVFGYQGGGTKAKALWSEKHGFWLARRQAKNRYWNAFGLGDPRRKEDTDIIVEVNPPFEGIKRNMAGLFLHDDIDGLYLAHRGRLGGGRTGIGQAAFLKHYRGEFTSIQDGDRESRVVVVGCISSTTFSKDVAAFVREVARIKRAVVQGSSATELSKAVASVLARKKPAAVKPQKTAAASRESSSPELTKNLKRARELALKLHKAYLPTGTGVFGVWKMPEAMMLKGMKRGSREHLLFITLTVTIDYQRDAMDLWRAAGDTFDDAQATRWLFTPSRVAEATREQVESAMRLHKLSKKHSRDAGFWQTVATTFHEKWGGDPRKFLADCGNHAVTVLERLKGDWHRADGKKINDYPYLRGHKIAPLWIRMLRDSVGLSLTGLEEVPIPVDVHILRATLATGVLRGVYTGPVEPVYRQVRSVWREAAEGLKRPDGQPLVAIDVDAALWNLSRLGCSPNRQGKPDASGCPPNCPGGPEGCLPGTVWMDVSKIELAT